MNNRELDKKLKIARDQSERFFDRFNFEQSRKLVYKRIEDCNCIKTNLHKEFLSKKLLLKGTITFLVSIIIILGFKQIGNNKSTPILQQSIGSGDNNYLISYFMVDNPSEYNDLLVTIRKKNLEGDYKVIYSSMMENANTPNPVAIMNMPFSESKFALVSSSNKDRGFIHYRFIKYNNDSVTTYLEENYISKGKIEINDGMLIEERIEPNDNYSRNDKEILTPNNKVYRYFIPVEFTNERGFTLSTNRIKLKEGAVLTLLGEDKTIPLEFEYDNDVLSKADNELSDSERISYFANFKINGKGTANLKIREKNNASKINEVYIEIID